MVKLIQGDITELSIDAIVNAANTTLLGGGGVDGAIHRVAGKELMNECRLLGGCNVGEAKLTKAYKLPARFVIHTVGPVWHSGNSNEEQLLANAYNNSLKLAIDNNIETIAFPNISTGVYNFPKEKAAKIAIAAAYEVIKANAQLKEVIFVCFDKENFDIYNNLLINIIGDKQ